MAVWFVRISGLKRFLLKLSLYISFVLFIVQKWKILYKNTLAYFMEISELYFLLRITFEIIIYRISSIKMRTSIFYMLQIEYVCIIKYETLSQ